ncbi:MAG TPA: hypothetical protein VGR96_19810 [Acidobacteriaceae bacterium]|nr:hypothetical protein [Acidobacteriaceae bacterium]
MRSWTSLSLSAVLAVTTAGSLRAQHVGIGGTISSPHAGGGVYDGRGVPPASAPHVVAPGMFSAPARSYLHTRVSGTLRNPDPHRQPPSRTPGTARDYRHHFESDGDGRAQGSGLPWLFPGVPYLPSGFVGYPMGYGFADYAGGDAGYAPEPDSSDGISPEETAQASPAVEASPADSAEPAGPPLDQPAVEYRPPYQGPDSVQPVHPQPATTLVFKDGRPNEQIHNYVLTGTALYDLDDESRRKIPVSQLDVTATEEINRSAGVDFSLPSNP